MAKKATEIDFLLIETVQVELAQRQLLAVSSDYSSYELLAYMA